MLLPTPSAGFDEPFEMLAACHARVQRSLDLLSRLVAHVRTHGADTQAADAARDVLRYFDIAAPAHHEDEERHVFPPLLASGDAALVAAVQRLRRDHVAMADGWQRLRPWLQRVAAREPATPESIDALDAAARHFAGLYLEHLVTEDGLVFPAARERSDPATTAAMGDEMARRRGVERTRTSGA